MNSVETVHTHLLPYYFTISQFVTSNLYFAVYLSDWRSQFVTAPQYFKFVFCQLEHKVLRETIYITLNSLIECFCFDTI